MLDGTDGAKDGGGTDSGRDTSENSGGTSGAEQPTSTIDKTKNYSGVDVEKLVADALAADGREQKTRADTAEKEVGRLTTSHGELTTRFDSLSTQMDDILRGREDAERESVKDKPDELSVVNGRLANAKEKRRLDGVVADITRQQTVLTEGQTALVGQQASANIRLAAMAGGVDEKDLAKFVPDGDPARLTDAVAILKRSATPVLDEDGKVKVGPDGKEIPAALRTKPASPLGTGSDSRSFSQQMLDKAKERNKR
ncbi:hypothetical protein LCGC14_1621400 [marine sediment metagenome]|uniref:Phage minor structural protein GP20 n=1 Tax=marine sediment metagenome TaxID=412755 RepID=A0A0F9I5E1_9ZZZZ